MKKLAIIAIYFLIIFVGYACFWTGNIEDYYFHGAKGLLDKWICWPIFIFLIGYAFVISIPKHHKVEYLYFGSGVLFTISFSLGIHVANSAMAVFAGVAQILLTEGYSLSKI